MVFMCVWERSHLRMETLCAGDLSALRSTQKLEHTKVGTHKSWNTDGIHVRMVAIPSENGDLVRWRLVSIKVIQYEWYDGFADTQALNVFPMSIARAASQLHTEHGHHTITAILDATFVCFHRDMDQLIHEHPPRETQPEGVVV